ncbi:MAG: hypothetical protein LH624_18905 [Cryobacterium sp.]|nr:hypothetical protein [Cryobacterium sp.]
MTHTARSLLAVTVKERGRRASAPLRVRQRHRVAVDPQGRGGVAVPEAMLSLQDVALPDQHGGHGVAEPVQCVTSG